MFSREILLYGYNKIFYFASIYVNSFNFIALHMT
jgi:hypothetical protein